MSQIDHLSNYWEEIKQRDLEELEDQMQISWIEIF